MNYDLTGKLVEKFDAQQVTETFRKREFVVLVEETINGSQGPRLLQDHIKFQLTQAKCETLDQFSINSDIKVTFNIRGRKWEKEGKGGYITSLEAWRLEPAAPAMTGQPPMQNTEFQQQYSNTYQQPSHPMQQVPAGTTMPEDDLPF